MGQLYTGSQQNLLEATIDTASAGDNILITGIANQAIRIWKIFITSASSVVITFKNGSTEFDGPMTMTSMVLDYDLKPWFTTSEGNNFVMNLGTGVQTSGRVYYTIG